jgi:hypothetical protein
LRPAQANSSLDSIRAKMDWRFGSNRVPALQAEILELKPKFHQKYIHTYFIYIFMYTYMHIHEALQVNKSSLKSIVGQLGNSPTGKVCATVLSSGNVGMV